MNPVEALFAAAAAHPLIAILATGFSYWGLRLMLRGFRQGGDELNSNRRRED
ncbi:hypothetical protein [Martelella sp. HB161492]|uniref:hypothetical protein n=1 Tax=Martelella sp. HB161492 TaxID=2720726 RepID=UPI0015926C90|nr:hypothetical protein [Martelella sp. HB161492]